VDYFYAAAKRRSQGALWPIFAPALTTALFFAKVGPINGSYNCPKCGKPMKVVARVVAKYKGNSGAKTSPRRTSSTPTAKKSNVVAKKRKPKGLKIKGWGPYLGHRKLAKKAGPKKQGPRKRGPSK
jgi:hypothetical protein